MSPRECEGLWEGNRHFNRKPTSVCHDPQIEEIMSSVVGRVSCRNSEILRVCHWGLIHIMKHEKMLFHQKVWEELSLSSKVSGQRKTYENVQYFPYQYLDIGQHRAKSWNALWAAACCGGGMCGSIRFFIRGQKRCMSGSRHHSLVVWNDSENWKNYQGHRPF